MTFGFIFILGFSGLLFLAPKNRTKYAYDGSNWLTRVDYPNGQIIKYAYNGAGDRVGEQIGNDVVLTSSYDAAGRLLSRGSDTFGYDADGNLINAVEGEVPASYTWNSDNRLTMVSRVHNGCKHDKDRNGYGYGHLKHGSSFVEYEKYDYLPEDWRRITRIAGVQKTAKNKKPAVEEEVFVSIYDGSDESHEYRLLTGKTASLQLEQSYISDPGTDDMNFTLSAGKTLTMLKDGLGSTVSLTGNDGKVLAKIGYDAWGRFMWPTEAEDGSFDRSKDDWSDYLNRLDKTRSFGKHNAWAFGKQFADRLTPYLYTGRRFSAMTGEYWNRHRYYSPALGRFTSKDPIGFNGGMNLYRYADNNPIIYTDPMGNSSCYKDLVVRVLNYFMDYNSPFVYSKATFSTAFSFFHQMENGPNISILDYSLKNTTHVTLGTTLIRKWTPETLAVFSSFDVPDTANEKIVNLVISDTNWRKDSRAGLSDTAVRSALIDGNYSDHSDPMKLGWTLAHETGHLLGLPDWFYRGELMMPANWPAMEFMEAHQDKILDSLAK